MHTTSSGPSIRGRASVSPVLNVSYSMSTIFTPPVGSQSLSGSARRLKSPGNKRKRRKATDEADEVHEQDEAADIQNPAHKIADVEYTAVVSPMARHQRRVAGQPLDQPPPSLPFPHAQTSSTGKEKDFARSRLSTAPRSQYAEAPRSLHLQHLAALTAIVHRSLFEEDFSRASRALGLLFRDASIRRSVAVRNQGYMGIGAEVLLRQGSITRPASGSTSASFPFAREGFENAKRFYERLIVKHPYHKSWPGSVNAVDFYLALFNIWIYVVHAEHNAEVPVPPRTESPPGSPQLLPSLERADVRSEQKVRELEEAEEIAARMDTCMASLPYKDEPELIRLRAMVALWIADLHEVMARIAPAHVEVSDPDFSDLSLQLPLVDEGQSWPLDHSHEATKARVLAEELLARLEYATDPDEDE
ncbi:hypothetical protein PV05_04588 [Exophiala xenobiotica]|uniref:Transcription factor domain-containing protein n=1 Tax=Exophiala xenobiotica TaxID=348802 RepID=A0A0D2EKB4_9EURO|nr:uncharacterized protein PV05_04588 [Exophiala xenobiotica]KIW55878.1 hypothetical protein PV05_04588 [Exophiala xenobiotica]